MADAKGKNEAHWDHAKVASWLKSDKCIPSGDENSPFAALPRDALSFSNKYVGGGHSPFAELSPRRLRKEILTLHEQRGRPFRGKPKNN